MKKLLLYFLITASILSCDDEEEGLVDLKPVAHNSDRKYYTGIPVVFDFDFFQLGITKINWDFGDGTQQEGGFNQHIYKKAGTYIATAKMQTVNGVAQGRSEVTVIDGPKVVGSKNISERANAVYKTPDGYRILVQNTTQGTSYLVKVNEEIEAGPEQLPIALGGQIGPWTADGSGLLAVGPGNVSLFMPDGTKTNNDFYSRMYPRDLLIDGQKLFGVYDSSGWTIVQGYDLVGGEISLTKQNMNVAGMINEGSFFIDKSTIINYYRNTTYKQSLVMGTTVDGSVLFSKYSEGNIALENITPLNEGFIINTYATREIPLKLTRINNNNEIVWERTVRPINPDFYQYFPLEIAIKESGNFVYVFFDNMRCLKLDQLGNSVWDKYFYSNIAVFTAVESTPDGGFLMVGNRQFNTETGQYSGNYEDCDVLYLKINGDGELIK